MVYTLKSIKWHAKYNPWFAYVLETLPQVKKWWKMNRKQLSEELRKRSMPQLWHEFLKLGQIHRLIAKDFPNKVTRDGTLSATAFWSRYLEDVMEDPEVWED